ncbi:MAG: hypothetical protein KJS68_02670, partial [Alphaproteobacteria bacterium]|nr:hypothetical protein [Alphaproteobacteria bacterium]
MLRLIQRAVTGDRRLNRPDVVPMRRVFVRLQRALAEEVNSRGIALDTHIVPETLELSADVELLDLALINLVRNATEALGGEPRGRITLNAVQEG